MIIGLTGYAGSGKDTVGREFKRRGWAHVSFASPLKKLALRVDPWVTLRPGVARYSTVVREIGLDRAKFEVPEIRRFLQALGQYCRDIFGSECWVDLASDEIDEWVEQGLNVVVTDVRYANEAEMIQSTEDGFVIFIHRPGVGPVNDHISDQKLPEHLIDAYLSNEGTLDDIPARVGAILEHLETIRKSRRGLADSTEMIQEWMNRPIYGPPEGEVSYEKKDELG